MIVQNDLTMRCWVCDISRGEMYNDRLKRRSEWSITEQSFCILLELSQRRSQLDPDALIRGVYGSPRETTKINLNL